MIKISIGDCVSIPVIPANSNDPPLRRDLNLVCIWRTFCAKLAPGNLRRIHRSLLGGGVPARGPLPLVRTEFKSNPPAALRGPEVSAGCDRTSDRRETETCYSVSNQSVCGENPAAKVLQRASFPPNARRRMLHSARNEWPVQDSKTSNDTPPNGDVARAVRRIIPNGKSTERAKLSSAAKHTITHFSPAASSQSMRPIGAIDPKSRATRRASTAPHPRRACTACCSKSLTSNIVMADTPGHRATYRFRFDRH